MGCALALPLVVALLVRATADVDVGVRAETRSSALAPSHLPTETREALSAAPHATLVADAARLRLGVTYAPRLWTSDVAAQPSLIVNHTLDARLETRLDRPWRAEASGSATRGSTDPLADPFRTATGPSQLPATEPLRYETLRTAARAELALDLRTTFAAGGAWSTSRAVDDAARALLPSQHGISLDAALSHRLTERDTLRLAATAGQTETYATGGRSTAAFSTAAASWRRRLTPNLEGWLGGGAALTSIDEPSAPSRMDLLPVGEGGLTHGGERVAVEITARVAPFVDRFSGDVTSMADARCAIRWRATEHLSASASGSAGARTDGQTALAGADLRFTWTLRPRLAVEAGLIGRWQHERRPDLPSFVEVGAVAAVTYEELRLFRNGLP